MLIFSKRTFAQSCAVWRERRRPLYCKRFLPIARAQSCAFSHWTLFIGGGRKSVFVVVFSPSLKKSSVLLLKVCFIFKDLRHFTPHFVIHRSENHFALFRNVFALKKNKMSMRAWFWHSCSIVFNYCFFYLQQTADLTWLLNYDCCCDNLTSVQSKWNKIFKF